MANSSNPANDLSSCEDEGPKWTIPRGLKPRSLLCLLPESPPNSERLAARHQFTQAFLLITGSLPAKCMIANGLALHISLAPVCDPSGARVGMEASQYLRFPCRAKC